MIFNMVGFGGVFVLPVVCQTSQPSPKENLIWVNSAAAMTSWRISYEKPETPTNGLVWIPVAGVTPAAITLSPDKKNYVSLNITSASQYVDDAWVSVPTKIYTNGAWKDLATFVINNGLFYYGDQSMFGHWTDGGRVTYSSDDNSFVIATGGGGSHTTGFLFDFTNYSKCKVELSGTVPGSTEGYSVCVKYQVANGNIKASYNLYRSSLFSSSRRVVEIDTSSITGPNYLCFTQVDATTVHIYSIEFIV